MLVFKIDIRIVILIESFCVKFLFDMDFVDTFIITIGHVFILITLNSSRTTDQSYFYQWCEQLFDARLWQSDSLTLPVIQRERKDFVLTQDFFIFIIISFDKIYISPYYINTNVRTSKLSPSNFGSYWIKIITKAHSYRICQLWSVLFLNPEYLIEKKRQNPVYCRLGNSAAEGQSMLPTLYFTSILLVRSASTNVLFSFLGKFFYKESAFIFRTE